METHSEMNELLHAARAGSVDALGQALESCRVYLTMVADRELDPALRAKGGASDIVQETFMEAQRAFPRFSSESKAEFQAWLRRMLLNNVADFRRRYQGTDRRAMSREIALEAGSSSADWRGALAAQIATPSGDFSQRETEAELEAAIRTMPEDYQQIITFRYYENRSFEEIAVLMNRTANAVRKLFARAIERLQRELDDSNGDAT